MDTTELKRKWDYLGEQDPLWAILTDDSKKGNRWDLEAFFETGKQTAERFMQLARHLLPEFRAGLAVDFGCGVGRLTQGHAPYFERTLGLDISEPMIAKARELNRFQDSVEYQLNTRSDLGMLESDSVDYLICHLVLQHIPAPIHQCYLAEFARVLRPGGIALVQLPEPFGDDWANPKFDPNWADRIDMYGTTQEAVLKILRQQGAYLLQVKDDEACGPNHMSYRYAFSK